MAIIKDNYVNPGVYIWKVRGKFRNGEPFIKMGDVTLSEKLTFLKNAALISKSIIHHIT